MIVAFFAVAAVGGSAGRTGCVAGTSAVFDRLRIFCFVEEGISVAGEEAAFVLLAADTGSFLIFAICADALGLASPSSPSASLTRRRFVARGSIASSAGGTCCRPYVRNGFLRVSADRSIAVDLV